MPQRFCVLFRVLLLGIAVLVIANACGGSQLNTTLEPWRTPAKILSLEDALATVDAAAIEPGADPAILAQLAAGLKEALAATGSDKFVSGPPAMDGSETGFTWEPASGLFRWRYFSVGDYDQNSEVGAPDLQPLAANFGETGQFPLYSPYAVADGDLNGELGSADIVPIAQNFLAVCAGYGVYMSANADDYPVDNGAPNGATAVEVAVVPFTAALGSPDAERLWFEYTPDTAPAPGTYWWVRPLDGEGNPGTPSNLFEFPDVPGEYNIYYNNYTYDGLDRRIRTDYSISVKFEGQPDVRYFNLVADGDWVIQNVPLITFEGTGEFQEVLMGFNLEDGDALTELHCAPSIDAAPITAPQASAVRMPLFEREVVINSGIDGGETPSEEALSTEIGGEVADWGSHGSGFPNQDCGAGECSPTAVSNSLQWLNDTYGVPADGKDTSIGAMKNATGWDGTCGADWPDLKREYMNDNGYGITTDEYPDPLDAGTEADAAACESALQALKDGKDVEMNGGGHTAAVVAMARLADGRYVMYVAHDTKQGEDGGTEVEKVIYDPSAASPRMEGGAWFNGGKLNNFVVESPDLLDLDIILNQIDYTLDSTTQLDSVFGSVDLTYTPGSTPQYFNLTVEGEWVIQNVPLLPLEGVGVETTVTMGFPLDTTDGTDITEAGVGGSIDDTPRTEAPEGSATKPVGSEPVNMGSGRPGGVDPGNPKGEFGDQVVDSASHEGSFPNQDVGTNECVPGAISNSLQWLQDTTGSPPAGKPIDVDTWKPVTDWRVEDGAALGWANRKAQHMNDNGYGVSTEGYPPTDSSTHEATAGECDQALQALKDGKDVEMNGAGHCAAVVGMAKLANGSYVIYVAHDTNQGPDGNGGTKIEKVIYDPADDTPVAEGGWGFNGKIINGFVAEWAQAASTTKAAFTQTDFTLEDVVTADSEWGELELTYEATSGNGVQYLNLMLEGEWVMQNVPVRDPDTPGQQVTVIVPFAVTGDPPPGENWVESFFDVSITPDQQTEMPGGNYLCTAGDTDYTMDSGEDGETLTYTGPTTDPLWWINSNFTDAAFHPWGKIVNQECGKGECAPAAVSNSLKMLKDSNADDMSGLSDSDIGIGTMKGATNWGTGGAPAGAPNTSTAWWNKKKAWMNARNNYPIKTEMVTDKTKLDDIIQAIRDGKDVELRVPGHVAMVTGCVKLADGTYVLEVAHDTSQGKDGGTKVELVKFDPSTGKLTGGTWINGKNFTTGSNNGAMFVVESVSPLNVKQTDYTVNGVTTTDSGWGEVTVTHTPAATGTIEFFNLSVNHEWVVENLPLPDIGAGNTQDVTIRYDLHVPDGTPLHEISYGYSIGPGMETGGVAETKTGLIDEGVFNMSDGDTGGSIAYAPPTGNMVWALGFPIDWAFHPSGTIVNQDCGDNECAPTACSNSLKMLQNQNPTAMAGLDDSNIGIGAMKPYTDWDTDGAPAGGLNDPGSWWNWKQLFCWLDPALPIDTQFIGDKADFGDVVDAIRDGKDVELRVPGHVVMVTGAMELPNGDYVLWVAHDTDQGPDGNGGTVIEPVYYDSSTNTFHGPGWIEGEKFSTPGDTQALFVVESVDSTEIDLLLDLPTHGIGTEGDPADVPNSVPVACTVYHSDFGDVTTDALTTYEFNPPGCGMVYGHNIRFDPLYLGIATLSAAYDGRPALPSPMVFNVNYQPPHDGLFCWPSETKPVEGEVITVTVFANETMNPLAQLSACRVMWEIGSPYAPGTINIGQFGGAPGDPDGVWEQFPAADYIFPDDSLLLPTEIPPGLFWAYDFYVWPMAGPEVPLVSGALFNFGLEVHSDLHITFQESDGVFDRTWYEDLGGFTYYWTDITNVGAPTVDMQ